MRKSIIRSAVVAISALSLSGLSGGAALGATPAEAPAPDVPGSARPPQPSPREGASAVPMENRDAVIGPGWKNSSDLAWTLSGDPGGLRVLVAKASDGYSWRNVATLSESGMETDRWIGNACLTGSGSRLVVAYAPRAFTNRPQLNQRGAFTAVVDLGTGAVTKLGVNSSLSYFTPGCGRGEEAIITQDGGERRHATRFYRINAVTRSVGQPITVSGQLTSAVPTSAGIVAVQGTTLARIAADGSVRSIADAGGEAFDLRVTSQGDLIYLEHDGVTARLHRLSRTAVAGSTKVATPSALARGPLTQSALARSGPGAVRVLGSMSVVARLGSGVDKIDAPADAQISQTGMLRWAPPVTTAAPPQGAGDDPTSLARPVTIDARFVATGKTFQFVVTPLAGRTKAEADPSPALKAASLTGTDLSTLATSASPSNPVEAERSCSVPRNDPRNQAMQPKPRQVEWAVDQAVRGVLTVSRPAGWKNLGMPAYTPQGLFPPVPLSGGGYVPAQVFLGVLAQESNLWQAPGSVVPGVTGNPLIGNYYGLNLYDADPSNDWSINWADADCGYGVSQLTDGMRLAGKERPGEIALPYQTQRAVALDFAANVAAGLRVLQSKWNETRDAGLRINDGDPSKIENWFYAVWAYNSGFHPQSQSAANNGAWGVGWANNPANPAYKPNRTAFLEATYADAAHPQDWPYPEKVMGWAGHPVEILESPGVLVAGYRPAWWNGDSTTGPLNRAAVKPPVNQFCDVTNTCYPGTSHVGLIGNAGACAHIDSAGAYDMKCWYHGTAVWKTPCSTLCGNELLRFSPGYAYQDDGTAYPPNCSLSGLPAGALIVDDQPDTVQSVRPGCSRGFANQGTFSFNFAADAAGAYPGKIDLWQLGAGFSGHFYYTHTRSSTLRNNTMRTTGTWTLNRTLNQWARVLVHLPDHGAHTQQAVYTINLGNGTRRRVMLQRVQANSWVSLGVFPFAGTPRVSLTSVTDDGDDGVKPIENEDIAWDAVAFQPLSSKPANIVVSLGDSFSSGEGASADGGVDYYRETDNNGDDPSSRNACHRSRYAWSRKGVLAGSSQSIGARMDAWDPSLEHVLIACSAARAYNLLPNLTASSKPTDAFGQVGGGQYGELSQLDKGFLDADTTLVTVSIGGNDARFGDILERCITLLTDVCQNSTLAGDVKPMKDAIPELINGKVKDSIVTVLKQIRLKAPNAKVVLMGYPVLLEYLGQCVVGIGTAEAPWLNTIAGTLATAMSDAVATANQSVGTTFVYFSDPRSSFAGRAICGNPEDIHGIVAGWSKTPGEPSGVIPPVSQQSFHPKISGTTDYANSLNATLRAMGL